MRILNSVNINLIYIKLNNFKNIKNGEISFSKNNKSCFNSNGKLYFDENPITKIIGLYGANGSGKTSIIEALNLLKKVMCGISLKPENYHYIYYDENKADLLFVFLLKTKNNKYLVSYSFSLIKKYNDSLGFYYAGIGHEKISYKSLEKNAKEKTLFENNADEEYIFNTSSILKNILSSNEKYDIDLRVIRNMSIKENTSFFFNRDFHNFINKTEDIFNTNEINFLRLISNALTEFGILYLFVITKNELGFINSNVAMSFNYFTFENKYNLIGGKMNLSLIGKITIEEPRLKDFEIIINQLNIVLKHIIPNLSLRIKDLNNDELNAKSQKIKKIELLAIKDNIEIPLKYESDGTKKIISILGAIIAAYNNPNIFLAIDELDSGIFEYLLGELLSILENEIMGQIIFTSHNLIILERLNVDSLRFSTVNEFKRFVSFAGLKNNNNFRDVYLRYLRLGNDDQNKTAFYSETDRYEISHALMKAGEIEKR